MSMTNADKLKAFALGGGVALAIAFFFVVMQRLSTGAWSIDIPGLTMLFGIGGVFGLILSSINSKSRKKKRR